MPGWSGLLPISCDADTFWLAASGRKTSRECLLAQPSTGHGPVQSLCSLHLKSQLLTAGQSCSNPLQKQNSHSTRACARGWLWHAHAAAPTRNQKHRSRPSLCQSLPATDSRVGPCHSVTAEGHTTHHTASQLRRVTAVCPCQDERGVKGSSQHLHITQMMAANTSGLQGTHRHVTTQVTVPRQVTHVHGPGASGR